MPADVYNYTRNPAPDAVFSADKSTLAFGDANGDATNTLVGALVQQFSAQYQQDIQELQELGSGNVYWSRGAPVGVGQIGRIFAHVNRNADDVLFMFPEAALDICKGGVSMALTGANGRCDANAERDKSSLAVKFNGVVVSQIQVSMQVDDNKLVQSIAFRFISMSK
jgi:hypothetical protein